MEQRATIIDELDAFEKKDRIKDFNELSKKLSSISGEYVYKMTQDWILLYYIIDEDYIGPTYTVHN